LTHSNQHTPDAHTIADLNINGIGLLFGHGDLVVLPAGTCPIYRSTQTSNLRSCVR
jgi:hypothetical protein